MERTDLKVAVIGNSGHGKTTLIAAIMAYATNHGLAKDSEVCFRYGKKSFTLIDCPGHEDYKSTMAKLIKDADHTILVVDILDGVTNQTNEQVKLAKESISNSNATFLTFLNKIDLVDDKDLLEYEEMNIIEILNRNEYPGNDLPIIKGSALEILEEGHLPEPIEDLIRKMDDYFTNVVD